MFILLVDYFIISRRCVNDATKGCDFVLNTTLYFPPSSQLTALDDLNEIHDHVFFVDERCDKAIEFAACYLLRIPCVDSLPRPICVDDCIVAETILQYACVKDFRFILAVNNTLSHTVDQFDCHRPESYINGTTEYSTHCLPLVKLRKYICVGEYVCMFIHLPTVHTCIPEIQNIQAVSNYILSMELIYSNHMVKLV